MCLGVGFVGVLLFCFFFQAEDGILDLVRSRGLGDVYKRQVAVVTAGTTDIGVAEEAAITAESCGARVERVFDAVSYTHLTLPTIYSV